MGKDQKAIMARQITTREKSGRVAEKRVPREPCVAAAPPSRCSHFVVMQRGVVVGVASCFAHPFRVTARLHL